MGHLAEIIRRNRCAYYRESFIELCIENLRNNESVPQSLKLLLGILGRSSPSYRIIFNSSTTDKSPPEFFMGEHVIDTSSLVHQLEDKYQLLQAFFADVSYFKSRAAEKLQQLIKDRQEEAEKQLEQSGRTA